MSNEIRNVTLSFPCREEWDKFEVVPGGRLCINCQHVVRDFRDCSSDELKEAMKTGQQVCGVFNKSQLSSAFLKAAAVAALAVALPACQSETSKPKDNGDRTSGANCDAHSFRMMGIMALPPNLKMIEGDTLDSDTVSFRPRWWNYKLL